MTEQERRAAEEKKNHRAHQAAEAAALLLLTRARNSAVSEDASAADIARAMQPRMRDAVVLGRAGARSRGVERLSKEAESVGADVRFAGLESEFARDWIRADRVSKSYTARWFGKATELESPSAASAATQGSLERIGVTESSEAFTSGRTAALDGADVVSETSLMRAWDATLDRRTCPICSSADGTIVGIHEAFPAGEPGSIHAWCRCGWSLIRVNFRG